MLHHTDQCCQLHERIEIHYYMDRYEAQLFTADYDGRKVVVGVGDTISQALQNLDDQLEFLTLPQIRKLPEIE